MSNTQVLEEAAEWLVTLRDGAVDAEARAQFTAWLCKSPEHVRAYLELTAIWMDVAALGADTPEVQALITQARGGQGNVIRLHDAPREGDQPIRKGSAAAEGDKRDVEHSTSERVRRIGLLAAGLAAIAIAAGGIASWQSHRFPTYVAGVGEQRSITLVDGSAVELNSRSRIRIRFSDDERLVELLEGQGLFKVQKDERRPFVVRSHDASVRAVGTQFDVYRKLHGTVVTVLEGRVQVTANGPLASASGANAPSEDGHGKNASAHIRRGQAAALELGAGEQVIIAPNQTAQPRTADLAAVTAWTGRQLVFESTPLIEVAHELNRYNTRQVVIEDSRLRDVLISGVFSSTDPSALLRFLREQPDIVVHESSAEIRVTRRE